MLIGALAAGACLTCVQAAEPDRTAVSLNSGQRSRIWNALRRPAVRTQISAGPKIGETIPNTMNMLPFARRLTQEIPAIGSFRYVLVHDEVLIVDPATNTVVDIISQ
jgi:hypothetical protein